MRTVNGTIHKNRRKKVLKRASGFMGGRHRLFRTAKDAIKKSGQFAYRDRRQRKRQFRALWITRINAAAREHGMSYSTLISGLGKAGVELDRKSLSEIAIHSPEGFKKLTEVAKG